MRARPLDDFLVGVDQRIGLARQRRNLDRKLPGETFGRAGANGGETIGDTLERRQTEADLKHGGEQQHCRQNRKCNGQRLVERSRLISDLDGVAGHRHQEMPLVAKVDVALDQAQALILRPGDVTLPRTVGAGGNTEFLQARQPTVPQRTRRAHLALARVEPRHLPVPARQRQFEQRLAERRRRLVIALVGRGDIGDQGTQINAEPAIEGALHRLPVKRRQNDASNQKDHHRPGGGRDEQAQREGVGPHN